MKYLWALKIKCLSILQRLKTPRFKISHQRAQSAPSGPDEVCDLQSAQWCTSHSWCCKVDPFNVFSTTTVCCCHCCNNCQIHSSVYTMHLCIGENKRVSNVFSFLREGPTLFVYSKNAPLKIYHIANSGCFPLMKASKLRQSRSTSPLLLLLLRSTTVPSDP